MKTSSVLSRVLAAATFLSVALAIPAAPSRDGVTFERGLEPLDLEPPAVSFAKAPCDGNNHLHDLFFDGAVMGGPLVGISWTPAATATLSRIEVFTGEAAGASFLAVWSDDGGAPGAPLAALSVTGAFAISPPNTWYGADLLSPVNVTGGGSYWIVWDPAGSEQCSCTDIATDVQQTYWGSFDGDVNGGANWFGPFSFPDRRWKFRVFCDGCPDEDGDGICDDEDLCAGTITPEPIQRLGVNRFALVDGDDVFDTTRPRGVGPRVTFTLENTGGCSCAQIADALHVGEGHDKFGCSIGVMRRWVDLLAP